MATQLHRAIPGLTSIDFVTWDEVGWTWRLRYSQGNGTRWVPFAMESSRVSMQSIVSVRSAVFMQPLWASAGRSTFLTSEMDFEGVFAKVFDGTTTNWRTSSFFLPG